jgi:hypothetical protein
MHGAIAALPFAQRGQWQFANALPRRLMVFNSLRETRR